MKKLINNQILQLNLILIKIMFKLVMVIVQQQLLKQAVLKEVNLWKMYLNHNKTINNLDIKPQRHFQTNCIFLKEIIILFIRKS